MNSIILSLFKMTPISTNIFRPRFSQNNFFKLFITIQRAIVLKSTPISTNIYYYRKSESYSNSEKATLTHQERERERERVPKYLY